MGALISGGYDIDTTRPTDGGGNAIIDDEGNIIDYKKVLNITLVKQFYPTTARIYARMTEEQKVKFKDLTEIDE